MAACEDETIADGPDLLVFVQHRLQTIEVLPVLVDDTQLVAESLEVVRTAEVFVIDPETWQLVYRGPMHDRITYEHQKPEAQLPH